MKKIISITLALMLICIPLSSCKIKNVSVVATVNGEDILTEEYNYYLLFAKQSILATAGVTEETEEFWNTTEIDGKTAGDLAKENALEDALRYTLIAQHAREKGLSTESEEAKNMISQTLAANSLFFEEYGMSEDAMVSVLEKFYLESALLDLLIKNGEIDASKENLLKTYEDNFRTIKHILISFTDPQTNTEMYTEVEAYEMALYVQELLDSGEDFDEVMNTMSMDPGLASAPNGYTFTNNGTMVPTFESAAFSLEIGQISTIIPSSYGYHILKREPLIPYEEFITTDDPATVSAIIELDYEDQLVTDLKAKSTIEKNEKVYAKVPII